MKKSILFVPLVVLIMAPLVFGQLEAPGADNTPAVGENAPDFERPVGITGSDTLGLKDFVGRSYVLLAFYPADFTGG